MTSQHVSISFLHLLERISSCWHAVAALVVPVYAGFILLLSADNSLRHFKQCRQSARYAEFRNHPSNSTDGERFDAAIMWFTFGEDDLH